MAKKTNSYRHILQYTGLFGGVQTLNILVGVVRNKLVAMILGPEGMGLISLFNSTLSLISNSTNFGVSISAVKNISEYFDKEDEIKLAETVKLVRSWSLLTGLFGILICIVLSPLLSRFTFSWDGHTLHFILLSPIVFMMAITSGELAILKGIRRLKALAIISIYNVLGALITSVPIYYFFKEKAIVPSLIIIALIQMVLTIAYSYRIYPLKIIKKVKPMMEGISMIRLGIAFVLAGILGSGADFLIRSYINNVAGINTVGLFNAGYMMTMTYVGMVFAAMETDYFPRLSGVNHLHYSFNQIVNRQIEVMLLLVSPLLVMFSLLLPILLPLLYTGKFMPTLQMMQIVMLAMYFRAITLPIQYIPLAKGDSISYLFLEAVYDIILILAVVYIFSRYGLSGAGWGITFAGMVDAFLTIVYTRWRYNYKISKQVSLYACLQIPIGVLTFAVTQSDNALTYWGGGLLLTLISLVISLSILRTKNNSWNRLVGKISKYLSRNGKD